MNREVHVWSAVLDQTPEVLERLALLLSSPEREKAGRFHFARDARRFVAAHGILRTILGGYLDLGPAEIVFAYGPSGKPFLAPEALPAQGAVAVPGSSLYFNMAHSGGLGVFAVAAAGEVGVDLELRRDLPDLDRLARIVLTPRELAAYLGQDPDDKTRTFFASWTRKEAVVKACGDGVGLGLDGFEVPLRRAGVVDLGSRGRWLVRGLAVASGFAGALAEPAPTRSGSGGGRSGLRVVRYVWPGVDGSRRGGSRDDSHRRGF